MNWIKKRDVTDEELERAGLAIPRRDITARCPNLVQLRSGVKVECGNRLSDVRGLRGGPVCTVCGIMFERGSAAVQ